MKRYIKFIFTITIILSLVFVLSACKEQVEGGDPTPEVTSTPEPTDTPAPTDTPEPTPEPTPVPTIEPGTGQYADGIKDEEKGVVAQFYRSSAEQGAQYCTSSMAVQFFATTEFNAVDVICPTWTQKEGHSIHFWLYAWAGTYFDTIVGEPIADEIFTDYKDGAFNKLEFDTLPDGEYLLYITNDEGWQNCGVWYKTEEHESQISYKDDEVWEETSIRLQVHYTKTPNNLYGPLSDPGF